MRNKRPTALTVMAILNIVFGGLGLLASLCIGGFLLVMVAFVSQSGIAKDPKVGDDLKDLMAPFQQVPGLGAYLIGSMALGLVLSTVLLVAGIGLLKMRNWARITSLVYAVLQIVQTLGGTVFTIVVLNPAMQRWQEEFLAKHGAGHPPEANPFAQGVGSVFGALVGVAYPVALLIVLNQPAVVAACRGERLPDSDLPPEEEDDYDRGWGKSAESPHDPGKY